MADLMRAYGDSNRTGDRHATIRYMLDRITGRIAAPEAYMARYAGTADEPAPRRGPAPASRPSRDTRAPSTPGNPRSRPPGQTGRRGKPAMEESVDLLDFVRFEPVAPASPEAQSSRLERPPRSPRRPVAPDEALRTNAELQQPVTVVKGIGPSHAETLAKIGIRTLGDLLTYLPRRYEDYSRLQPIRRLALADTPQAVVGTVLGVEVRAVQGGRKDLIVRVGDGTGEINVVFFGQQYLLKQMQRDTQWVFRGRIALWRGQFQLTNPEYESLDLEDLQKNAIVPVYGLTEGLSAKVMRRHVRESLRGWANRLVDPLPAETLERADLAEYGWSLWNLHFPETPDHLHHARRRYLFDELLSLQLGVLANRREWQSQPGIPLHMTDAELDHLAAALYPFDLTGDQRQALREIRQDIASDVPMNRLIQGDVGSGKTVVAVLSMMAAVRNGQQAALMAPTSILAEQHYRGLVERIESLPETERPTVALLTSALGAETRQAVYAGLADGSIDIVIGTQALIQPGLAFHALGLAVVDEQHRFGVEQRGLMRGKGTNPHLLVMTATPIPRTLALTLFADLDLSVIRSKPAGRLPISTKIIWPLERERAFGFIRAQIEQGRQAFIVHALVEESDTIDARAAVQAYEELLVVFHRQRVCLLHGRMSASEKDEVMLAFARNEYDVMVTTSVAEVGLDVPNASVIMIEGANRFGLAQLHQLRGRVGRGEHPSYCLLVPDTRSAEAEQRLTIMESTDDGFKLAELDWEIRGAGDLLGTRQSGQSLIGLASHLSLPLVEDAQREARAIALSDPGLDLPEHALLAQIVGASRSEKTDVS
jgi:ATP-dependent DNA helicase RecG